MNEYDIAEAFRAIEEELIRSMIQNMDRHRAEETEEEFQWSMWQAEQLKNLERYKRQNQKKYRKQFQSINNEISVLIREARDKGNMNQEIHILKAIQRGYRFPNMPQKMLDLLEEMDGKTFRQKAAALLKMFRGRNTARGTGEFFKLNDRKLEALIEATVKDMEKAETAILRKANDEYRKAIFNAQVYANTGAGTYEKAVDMATKDMLSCGLNCVVYANGARHTLEDYADMAIRTASKRAYLQGEGEKRQEWGVTTVIVNKRGNPCPKCLPFCGKVLIDDVWSGGKAEDGPYPLMSTAIAYGLYHPRCKDSHTTYFPGISTEDDTWTQEELDAVSRANRQESRHQHAKRQAEKYGRLGRYSLDPENKRWYKRKASEWKSVAKDLDNSIMEPSEEEQEVLLRYKSFESYMINDALRNVKSIEELSIDQRHFVRVLDQALLKMPKYRGNLIRTIDFSDWPDADDRVEAFLSEYAIGENVTIHQYWSASKKDGYNDHASIKIYIQNSENGRDISAIGLDEGEVLYERESTFTVISKALNEDTWFILLQEV